MNASSGTSSSVRTTQPGSADPRPRPPITPWGQLSIRFSVEPAAVRQARESSANALAGWGIPRAINDTLNVVSELMTNAVKHTSSGQVELVLTFADGLLLVEVRDESTQPPVLVRDAGDEEGGRGLQLVHAFASDWGWLPLDQAHKSVWALMPVRSAALALPASTAGRAASPVSPVGASCPGSL